MQHKDYLPNYADIMWILCSRFDLLEIIPWSAKQEQAAILQHFEVRNLGIFLPQYSRKSTCPNCPLFTKSAKHHMGL